MLNKLKPLDDMGCDNFKSKLSQFIKNVDKPLQNIMIEGNKNGLFQQIDNFFEKGRKFEFIIEQKNELIIKVEILVDEGIQNPATIEEIEEIHKSILSDVHDCKYLVQNIFYCTACYQYQVNYSCME